MLKIALKVDNGLKVRSYCTEIAVPIYRLLSPASHRSITVFLQVKINLTFMRHRNAITWQFLCSRVQCGNARQLRRSMNRPLRHKGQTPKGQAMASGLGGNLKDCFHWIWQNILFALNQWPDSQDCGREGKLGTFYLKHVLFQEPFLVKLYTTWLNSIMLCVCLMLKCTN